MIDSHCHLADDVFSADLEPVITRAREAGLERALVILAAGNASEAEQASRIEDLWPGVCFAVGVHPHQAHEFAGQRRCAADLVRQRIMQTPSACAIGEIGLDYHYDFSPHDVQQAAFHAQVRLARELRLPVVIHTREADRDTIDILREAGGGEVGGVLHCFTGGPPLAKAGLDLGLYISVAGIITFPKAIDLRKPCAAYRSIGCSWKPTARFLRRFPTEAVATSRRTSPKS